MVEGVQIKKGFNPTELGLLPADWNVSPLKEIGSFKKGQGIPKSELKDEGLPCVLYGEIYTKYHFAVKELQNRIDIITAKNSKEIKYGDILFAGSGETAEDIGKCFTYIGDQLAYAGGDIIILTPKQDIDSIYLGYVLSNEQSQNQKLYLGQGSSVYHIYASNLEQLRIPLPPTKAEQTAIATALSDMDALIEAQEKLIVKKRMIRQGVMQELLSGRKRLVEPAQEGYKKSELGLIPEDWEIRQLGEVGDVKMCKRIFNYQTTSTGTIPFYKIGTFEKEADAYISEKLFRNYKQRFAFPKKGDILISASGTIGRTVVYNGKPAYFQDSNIIWLDNKESLISNEYLFYVYQVVKYSTEGGTIQRLYNDIIKNTNFICPPDQAEQNKITEVLMIMDTEIEQLESQLLKYKHIKTGMMQDLLTGKRRLV